MSSPNHPEFALPLPDGGALMLGRTAWVMGILNVTPDSFSDGGRFENAAAAVAQARAMVAEGAAIIDVGGESTRPSAIEISVQAELDRVMPVLDGLRGEANMVPVSIDTYKAVVADQAIQAGAVIINDVHGLMREPEIADVAALYGTPLILMHWDAERDRHKDVVSELVRYFERSIAIARDAGIPDNRLVLDPGFGFAKTLSENYAILNRLHELQGLGLPLLVGTSRKSMIGKLLDKPSDARLPGTIATNVLAYRAGAHIFRVHDVAPHVDALRVAEAVLYGPPDTATQIAP